MNWSGPNSDYLPKWITFGPDQFILVMTISFWLWPNHYGQVQINLVRLKPFWTNQNCFGHIEGQGITVKSKSKISQNLGPFQIIWTLTCCHMLLRKKIAMFLQICRIGSFFEMIWRVVFFVIYCATFKTESLLSLVSFFPAKELKNRLLVGVWDRFNTEI